MRVLITGGAGFLGRQVVAAANEAGHEVLAPRRAELDLETLSGADRYFGSVKRDMGGVDAIIHSAAYYGGIGLIVAEPATVLHRNCLMGLNVFELARRHDVGRVIAVGSCCAYPGYVERDLREEEFWDGPLHETVESYGFSKKLLLAAQRAYYKQHGVESNHLILTNLYGAHDVFREYRSHVLSALIKKFSDAADKVVLWGDGTPVREFLYVKDAAAAIVRSLTLGHDLKPINIGTGIGTSIGDLSKIIAEKIGFRGAIEWDTSKPNGTARKVLDISHMKERLGWSPRWSLDAGLGETIEWYLANKTAADARL